MARGETLSRAPRATPTLPPRPPSAPAHLREPTRRSSSPRTPCRTFGRSTTNSSSPSAAISHDRKSRELPTRSNSADEVGLALVLGLGEQARERGDAFTDHGSLGM